MHINTKSLQNKTAIEQYVSIISDTGENTDEFMINLFQYYHKLTKQKLSMIHERIYANDNQISKIIDSRKTNPDTADFIPNYFVTGETKESPITIQLYLIGGDINCDKIKHEGKYCGVKAVTDSNEVFFLCGINNNEKNLSRAEQLQKTLQTALTILNSHRLTMKNILRNWFWLNDILKWYTVFNRVRTKFFIEQGLISKSGICLPASTAIGLKPYHGGFGALDVIANSTTQYFSLHEVSACQNSAYDYGSAFSRAVTAKTFAGNTVYISGTAAIDKDGKTTNVNNIEGQLNHTVSNLQQILNQISNHTVLSSVVYCKNNEVKKQFLKNFGFLDWNYVTVITDICRKDLLCEIEMVVGKNG